MFYEANVLDEMGKPVQQLPVTSRGVAIWVSTFNLSVGGLGGLRREMLGFICPFFVMGIFFFIGSIVEKLCNKTVYCTSWY